MASEKVVTLTDGNFRSTVLEADKPVLVDFWAAWCGPCKMIAPVIDELANDFDGKAIIGKVNVDDNRQTASEYGIMSIPTLLLFKNGQVVDKAVGFKAKADLAKLINSHL
ncbi:thioredoxin [Heliorestis convoluta]|uniref:Thioredoxin n=1 Tax=Heliorestis convoluta TaxID=356322 RepID=A0A5Q2MWF0_9FIRM|nr:thioredoxin [Heliorestis convoluta]QGG46708.1 thioredoxin [Heliorestis convoluta]